MGKGGEEVSGSVAGLCAFVSNEIESAIILWSPAEYPNATNRLLLF